jgi:transposase-like protein
VNLWVPKLRRQTFETAIIERYRRRESSVEEALIEIYVAGISVRSLDDARQKMKDWRKDYNEVRPHSAIGNKALISLLNGSSAPPPA